MDTKMEENRNIIVRQVESKSSQVYTVCMYECYMYVCVSTECTFINTIKYILKS